MNEEKNMVEMSFEGQHESLPSLLEVISKEDLSYQEDLTSRNNEKLEKLTRADVDAQYSKALLIKEDESTSPKSHKMIKYEVLKTIRDMTSWSDMIKELKIE